MNFNVMPKGKGGGGGGGGELLMKSKLKYVKKKS